jgi:transposase
VGKITRETVLFFCDEMRYGLISNYRRSWSPIGVRTIIDNQQAFTNRYLFSAVSPIDGESFHIMGLEENSSAMMQIFFGEMEKKFRGKDIVVVFDNAPSHKPKIIHERESVTCINLPPYSPELNPAERFFEEIRKATANQIFENIEDQEKVIEERVKTLSGDYEGMKKLLGYEWIKRQWEEVN